MDAAYNLGVCYEEGRGVPVDHEAAFGWYAEAAAGGDADALFALGVCYNDGVGIPLVAFLPILCLCYHLYLGFLSCLFVSSTIRVFPIPFITCMSPPPPPLCISNIPVSPFVALVINFSCQEMSLSGARPKTTSPQRSFISIFSRGGDWGSFRGFDAN